MEHESLNRGFKSYLGLGKTMFNSSACLFRSKSGRPEIEVALSERILRKKSTGAWPAEAIRKLKLTGIPTKIAENRDVQLATSIEDTLDRAFPFYQHLKSQGLAAYSRRFNQNIESLTHHRCHAMAAVAMSPFEKCIVLVLDGAGSQRKDFPEEFAGEVDDVALPPHAHEECSVFLHDHGALTKAYKRWRIFRKSEKFPEHVFSEGAGILYEKTAEYIFNSGRAAGKVMGLAAFGKSSRINERWNYLENLDWSHSFKGTSKLEWEESGRFSQFADLAASVQEVFEIDLLSLAKKIRQDFPEYGKLILTGGCALNCTANMKLLESRSFEEVYVPPFPGDESIGFGAASFLYYTRDKNPWEAFHHEDQQGYFGLPSEIPKEKKVEEVFAGFEIVKPPSITEYVAKLLAEGNIVGWFQGRSESGPRALGNRSILADPRIPSIKDRLNREIKFRESFRPYGASCLHESAGKYFDIPPGFNSPYMSFAVRPRAEYRELLKEVCHVDGTSRIQTVRPKQNELFHQLLRSFESFSGLPCLLNTSLNIMGEPMVESLEDARNFLEKTPVHGIAVGAHYIRRKGAE